ncbi:MAG: hypothetical protein ACRYGK_16660, partial [Janthinobacterium lividum]
MGALDLSLPLLRNTDSSQLAVEQHRTLAHTVWITLRHDPARGMHNFSLPLLHQLHETVQQLHAMQGDCSHGHAECTVPRSDTARSGSHRAACTHSLCQLVKPAPVHYAVMRSDHADYFNAGGDLKYFRRCIAENNRQGLYQYSML